MKRLIYILAIVITATSCTFTEEVDINPNSDETLISFSTWVNAATRAVQVDNTDLQEYGFYVSAYLDKDEYNFLHYFDSEATYSNSVWSYDDPQFWTSSGSITFDTYAFDSSVLENGEGSITQEGRTLEYICSPNIDEQIDLLAVSTEVANKAVAALSFGHALSQINFTVDFSETGEKNVTLTKINIAYHNIVSEGTYTFGGDGNADSTTSGSGVWSLSDDTFLGGGYSTTAIEVELTEKENEDGDMIFEPENALMIIPQPINIEENGNYISVSVEYTLNVGSSTNVGDSSIDVTTGFMELPVPDDSDYYNMGTAYTYNIQVNGELLSFDVSIVDAQKPVFAYGNIDLGLITEDCTYTEYKTQLSDFYSGDIVELGDGSDNEVDESGSHIYYATSLRVAELLNDDVRDFIIIGNFGATTDNSSDGKLGYYGSTSSPFYIAANSLGMMPKYKIVEEGSGENITYNMDFEDPSTENLFSIDMRGVYNFPTWKDSHDTSIDTSTDVLDDTAPILTSGIFKDLPLLKEVIFPLGLSAIGEHSFQNCMSLTSVDLSEVIHIEKGAFVDCVGLTEVIGGAITRVHDYGFDDCESLTTIDLSNLVEVNSSGFVSCASLGEVNLSKLAIADDYAFKGCSSMTLESSDMTVLTTVGSGAFQDCSSIENVEFLALTSVGDYAFSGCTNMTNSSELVLGNLDDIGAYAFQDCANIKEIQFPNITKVADGAFFGCTNVKLTGNLTDLTSIGSYAFQYCANIGTIDLQEVESIGSYAFYNCTSLNLADNDDLAKLTKIEEQSFSGCESISVTDLNLDGVISVDDYGLYGCSSLVGVSLDNVETIGNYAFQYCTSLSSDLVMSELTTIGNYAFSGCSNLTGLTLDKVESVGGNFISSCTSLERFVLPLITENSVTWPSSTSSTINSTTVSSMLRNLSSSIKYLDISSLKTDDGNDFVFPAWTSWVKENNAVLETVNIASCLELAGGAFYYCTTLIEIDASSAITVGGNAFQNCTSLETVNLSSATTIGSFAFSGCTSLETLTLTSFAGSLDSWGLQNYTALKYVDIATASTIENGTFNGCTALEEVIASSATSIGSYAFQGCNTLKSLDLRGVTEVSEHYGYDEESESYVVADWAYPFYETDTTNCILYLNAVQYATVEDGNVWYDTTWGTIINADVME